MTGRRLVFVLGGARSGKSAFAERLVLESGLEPVYLATARIWDDEMRQRVDAHRSRRGDQWTEVEEPLDLAGVLAREAVTGRAVLVDCLTLWQTNLMLESADMEGAAARLSDALASATGTVVLVSNEVGLGIVPENAMAREFRDHAGRLNQRVAEQADEVHFVAAGLPLKLKG